MMTFTAWSAFPRQTGFLPQITQGEAAILHRNPANLKTPGNPVIPFQKLLFNRKFPTSGETGRHPWCRP